MSHATATLTLPRVCGHDRTLCSELRRRGGRLGFPNSFWLPRERRSRRRRSSATPGASEERRRHRQKRRRKRCLLLDYSIYLSRKRDSRVGGNFLLAFALDRIRFRFRSRPPFLRSWNQILVRRSIVKDSDPLFPAGNALPPLLGGRLAATAHFWKNMDGKKGEHENNGGVTDPRRTS